MASAERLKRPGIQRLLDGIELAGNKLPHPAVLFIIFALLTIAVSHIFYLTGAHVTFQQGARTVVVEANSLLTREGIAWMFTSAVGNFTGFAPLGLVLVAMLGVGAAEHVGLLSALIRKLMLGAPKSLITLMVIFVGLLSSVAADAGYLVVIPLGAAIFHAVGRHPLAGLAAAFFGVAAGFSANIVISLLDIMLAGITQEAASMVDPYIVIAPTSNLYFMIVSTFVLLALGYFITEKITVPRLGEYRRGGDGAAFGAEETSPRLTPEENRGLRFAGLFLLGAVAFLLLLSLPPAAPLRHPETGALFIASPFMSGMVPIIMLLFLAPAVGYGVGMKSMKDDKSILAAMTKSMETMGGYLVLAFFMAQFISYFSYSNLATILSVNGANFLSGIGFTGLPLMLAFIVLTTFLNFFMGSASAKWAIMAPIFVPMFMYLGFDPTFTQLAYRIGDSVTNVITPLLPYFALIVVFAEKYDKRTGLGTVISLMLPYSLLALLAWSLLLVAWYFTGLPIGLGGGIYL